LRRSKFLFFIEENFHVKLFLSIAVCGQMAARETTGEALIISGLHNQSRVFVSGGNRKKFFKF
jgi:hypothetical protein